MASSDETTIQPVAPPGAQSKLTLERSRCRERSLAHPFGTRHRSTAFDAARVRCVLGVVRIRRNDTAGVRRRCFDARRIRGTGAARIRGTGAARIRGGEAATIRTRGAVRFDRLADARVAVALSGEAIHPFVPERSARGEVVVIPAQQPDVRGRRRAALRARDDVIELDPHGRTAHATGLQRPLAAALVAVPHFALHARGDVVCLGKVICLRRPRRPSRPVREALLLRVILEQEVERGFEDVFGPRLRERVRERVASSVQLVDEPA
ncbi:MAG TPA: hypothetical protein VFK85_12475 [Anaeromyxobacteraceae bacterium]|nr:hypothetical protein [Anaeromyxobacteraceae bacterium]